MHAEMFWQRFCAGPRFHNMTGISLLVAGGCSAAERKGLATHDEFETCRVMQATFLVPGALF
jgi:hypothetical protein